jgi:exonuclease III
MNLFTIKTLISFTIFSQGIFAQKTEFKVMAWNILRSGNQIENGVDNVADIIKEINPDIVLMVETYGSGPYIAKKNEYNFHLVAKEGTALDDKSVNLSIYSKFPFGERIDTDYPFFLGGIEIFINNKKVRFFSNWFHYQPWNNKPEDMGKTVQELLDWERTEHRYNMIQKVLPYFEKYAKESDSIPIIVGGDMNSPSHLDWSEKTKNIHNGLVVPWYSTKVFEDLGFTDSFREKNPNPIKYPGITWDHKERDDSHRIDYIFYKGKKLKSTQSKTYMQFFNEQIEINNKRFAYPSDHGIVVTTFKLKN